MGIPQFFRHLREKHPHLLAHYDGGAHQSCDELYLDYNCAVHRCARAVLERFQARLDAGDLRPQEITREAVDAAVIEDSYKFVVDLCRKVQPRALVYVAVDGVPPRSKMAQQRSRRFLAQWRRTHAAAADADAARRRGTEGQEGGEDAPSLEAMWDTNGVTPGTPFMRDLGRRLEGLPNELPGACGRPGLRVVVSGPDEPREGEQKVFRHLRRHATAAAAAEDSAVDAAPTNTRHEGTRFLYGLDADLLLLGSLCPVRNLRILRPTDDHTPGETDDGYFLVDIDAFRTVIHAAMRAGTEAASVHDFVALCSLIGNDFVPGLACLKIADGAIEFLLGVYRQQAAANEKRGRPSALVVHDPAAGGRPSLSREVLNGVLEGVAAHEDGRMQRVDRSYYEACAAHRRRVANAEGARGGGGHDARGRGQGRRGGGRGGGGGGRGGGRGGGKGGGAEDLERYPLLHPFPDVIRPGTPGWRLRYYRHLMNRGDAKLVHEVCAAFVRGLDWSIAYHTQFPVSHHWSYPFAYAPTALDLANFSVALLASPSAPPSAPPPVPPPAPSPAPVAATPPLPQVVDPLRGPNPRTEQEEEEDGRGAFTTDMQLLMVLPPQSFDPHVDARLRSVSYDVRKGCTHYYPRNFRVLTYLKSYVSDCPPVLPEVDVARIRAAVDAAGEGSTGASDGGACAAPLLPSPPPGPAKDGTAQRKARKPRNPSSRRRCGRAPPPSSPCASGGAPPRQESDCSR